MVPERPAGSPQGSQSIGPVTRARSSLSDDDRPPCTTAPGAFQAWNLDVEEGTVDVTTTATPAAHSGQLEVQSNTISSTLHTAVSSEAADGDPDQGARLFDVSDGEITSVVQPTVSASGAFMGGAERVVETAPSDPGEVPFWAAVNPATRGVGQHFIAERIHVQHLDPGTLTG